MKGLWGGMATPCMSGAGPRDADVLVLGDAPWADDDREGRPFAGDEGKTFRMGLPAREYQRVRFSYLTRCRQATAPGPAEIHACSVHLEEEVETHNIRAILGVGPRVVQRFFPGIRPGAIHGLWMPAQVGSRTVWFYSVMDPLFLKQWEGKWGVDKSTAWSVFSSDVKRFFREIDVMPKPRIHAFDPASVILPATREEAENILATFTDQPGVDIETTGLRPYAKDQRILIGAMSDGKTTMAFPIDHPSQQTEWGLPLLLDVTSTSRWTAHNGAFEYGWLKWFAMKERIPYEPQQFDDSMAAARLFQERSEPLGLDDVTRIHLGIDVKKISEVDPKFILQYPLEQAMRYCGMDAAACALIFAKLIRKVDRQNYDRYVETARTVSDMNLLGLTVDKDNVLALKAEWEEKARIAEAEARKLYEAKAFKRERGKEIELSLNTDVGYALTEFGKLDLPKTAKAGKTQVDESALARYRDEGHPFVVKLFEYREATKIISTYVQPMLDKPAENEDGLLHPVYNAYFSHTTRLTSEDPNIQNFPSRRQKAIRRPVRPDIVAEWLQRLIDEKKRAMRHVFLKCDYKALEARTIAMMADDWRLISAFINGLDIHSKWRDRFLFHYPDYYERLCEKTNTPPEQRDKVLKSGRDIIKSDFVFLSFFGGGAESCSARTGIPLRIVNAVLGEFWDEYSGVHKWIKKARNLYRDTGSMRLKTGITRHGLLSGNEPINNPAQGTGAQIVAEAMNALARRSREERDLYLHPRINIHDDLTFICPDDDRLEWYIQTIGEELVALRFPWQTCPMGVDVCIGETWADMHEVAAFTGPYHR